MRNKFCNNSPTERTRRFFKWSISSGTAFDIVGTNTANLEPTINSFKLAVKMNSGTQIN